MMSTLQKRAFGLALVFFVVALFVLVFPAIRWGSDIERVESYHPEIQSAAAEFGVSPTLLAGLVFAESRGHAEALSSVDAMGLCQLLPSTADEIAQHLGISGPPFETQDNLRMGAYYLAKVTRPYEHEAEAIAIGLLCYRMGPASVSRGIEKAGGVESWLSGMKSDKQSAWGYVEQIMRMETLFSDRWSTHPSS